MVKDQPSLVTSQISQITNQQPTIKGYSVVKINKSITIYFNKYMYNYMLYCAILSVRPYVSKLR